MSNEKESPDNFDPEELAKLILDDMEANDYNGYMDFVYELLVSQPEEVANYDTDTEEKLKHINKLIEHFSKLEEYQKCKNLRELKESLNA